MVDHHTPDDGEIFVGLDGWEYEWREGGLVQIGQGFEVNTEMTADPGVKITVTDLEGKALADAQMFAIIDDPPTQETP